MQDPRGNGYIGQLPVPADMLLLAVLGCTSSPTDSAASHPRALGDRTPIATSCDPIDSARCWLPFPSSAQTVRDDTTPTGLRVSIDEAQLPNDDDPSWLELADGFSRVSPALTAVRGALDPARSTASVRFFVAWQADDPSAAPYEVPAWSEAFVDGGESLLIGYPLDRLPPNADIVVVVPDELVLDDGSAPAPEANDRVALGLDTPASEDEHALADWYAPIRDTLTDVGVDPARVFRAWSFTTRSVDDPARRLRAMFADVEAAPLTVTVDEVEIGSGSIAAIVTGTVDAVPDYRGDDYEWVHVDDAGRPAAVGTLSAPFRVVIPAGKGDYPTVLYGHGTGGDVDDSTFDGDIAARGIAKAATEFWGWDADDFITQMTYLSHVFDGAARSTSALLQALADARALELALRGPLGDVLAADTLGGAPNPAAGRRPLADHPMWVGGSLGGTMGGVMVAADEDITTGIVNVPAAAWTHLIPRSILYTQLAQPITEAWYPTDLDARAAIAMSQNEWDDVDGAAWEDPDSVLLIQESIGDPVVPNVGTAMLARARGATMVGAPLDDLLPSLPQADALSGQTGITEYLSGLTEDYDIHGFAATDSPAGVAARQQLDAFFLGWRDGQPPPIVLPDACAPTGACDFSTP